MEIISRKEAMAQGLKRYFTGVACKRGHVAERQVSGGCTECGKKYRQENKDKAAEYRQKNKEKAAEYRQKNKEKAAEYHRKYYQENKEKRAESQMKYRQENKEKVAESQRKYYQENKEKRAESQRKYNQENKEKRAENSSRRRATKRHLTPPRTYQDRPTITKLYKNARELSALTGRKFHIDHIWPLALGGVHHPCNLQILEATTNIRKHAAHDGVSGVSYEDFMLAVSAYA